MGVSLVVQAKVTIVLGAVYGLTQGAQHDRLDHMEIRAPLNLLQQRLVILRRRTFLALVQRETQLTEKGAQLFLTLQRRRIVDTIKCWDLMLLQECRRGDVGAEHALLDQLVRIVALGRLDLGDLAIGTEDDTRLLGLEIDRAAGMTRLEQHLVERIELLEMRQHFGVLPAQPLAFG